MPEMAKRRIKLMWDYDAFPLWAVAGEDGPWPLREIKISDSLRADLQAWSDEWTDVMWGDGGPDSPTWKPPPDDHRVRWEAHGRELATRVQREAGEGYEVGIYDEQTGDVDWPSDRPYRAVIGAAASSSGNAGGSARIPNRHLEGSGPRSVGTFWGAGGWAI